MLKTRFRTAAAVLGMLHAIFGFSIAASAQDNKSVSPAAKIYLENALDTMQKNSLLKRAVNWANLRRETFERAKGARETIDTWDAIRFALNSIGDHHSFLQLTKDLREKEDARRKVTSKKVEVSKSNVLSPYLSRRQPEGFTHKTGNCTIPRIVIPMFASQQGDGFAATLNKFIAVAADARNPCGWIVDLRGNSGGNVSLMLPGIGALLGEGTAYYSLNAEAGKTFYFYKNGRSGLIEPNGTETIVTKIEAAYQVKKRIPVAILIDKGTANSGEGIATAFRGRANTRFFGTHTYGVSTANEGICVKRRRKHRFNDRHRRRFARQNLYVRHRAR